MVTFNIEEKVVKDKTSIVLTKGKGIQCRECEGFGHIQAKCPNFLRKFRKIYNVTFSDNESHLGRTCKKKI